MRGVVGLIHDPGRGAVAKVQFSNVYHFRRRTVDGDRGHLHWPVHLLRQARTAVPNDDAALGDAARTVINNVEKHQGDKGKFAKTSGASRRSSPH